MDQSIVTEIVEVHSTSEAQLGGVHTLGRFRDIIYKLLLFKKKSPSPYIPIFLGHSQFTPVVKD